MRAYHLSFISLLPCASSLCACAEATSEDPPSHFDTAAPSASGTSAEHPPVGTAPLGGAAPNVTSPSVAPSNGAASNGAASNGAASSTTAPSAAPGSGSAAAPVDAAKPSPPPLGSSTPAATGPSGEVLFSDDFEDGADRGWVAGVGSGSDPVGDWSVVATEEGHAYAQTDDSFSDKSWSVGGDVRWTDVSVETRFRFTAASKVEDSIAMLALRLLDMDDYYYLQYRGDGSVKIRKRKDGSDDDLSSDDLKRTAVLGQWISLRFVAQGGALSAYVDGASVGSSVMDAALASGGIALGVQKKAAVEFDDVRVTRP